MYITSNLMYIMGASPAFSQETTAAREARRSFWSCTAQTASQSSLCEDALGAVVKMGFITVALMLLISDPATAQQAMGSVCVAARIDDPFWQQPATLPNRQINSQGLRVKVDKRPSTPWPDRKSLKIEGLETSERHIPVVLGSDGKPIESVKFRFSDYKSTELCMSYDGYQGERLQEAMRRTPWCKCH
jgi:hypothetical protein